MLHKMALLFSFYRIATANAGSSSCSTSLLTHPPNDIQRVIKSTGSKKNKVSSPFRTRDIIALVTPNKATVDMFRKRGVSSNIGRIFEPFCVSYDSSTSIGKHNHPHFQHQLEENDHKNNARRFALSVSRGGGEESVNSNTEKPKKNKLIGSLLVLAILGTLVSMNREAIASFDFKEVLATQLDTLSSMGTKGLVTYVFAFIMWELVVGVTTPVETAAGMAFGFQKGIVANAIGKTSGAILAFLLGRFVLKDYVTKKLENNEYMDLVKDSITKTPIRVALIWRFSFLPEQIKNFGLSILPVKTWQFVTAVLLHGFPFTLLWTFMGNEMGLFVRGVVSQPSKILKVLTAGVYVLGFFISPSLVGLWVKGLRDEKMKREGKDKKGK